MTEQTIHAAPVGALKMRVPGGGHLPPEGAKVAATTYWRRRANEGSVALADTPAAARAKAKEMAAGLEPGAGKTAAKATPKPALKPTTAKEG